jgi:hypothetical protein
MPQLALFEETETSSGRQPLDAVSERLLQEYGQQRASQGASPQSVRRELSQLRSIARACGRPGVPLPHAHYGNRPDHYRGQLAAHV